MPGPTITRRLFNMWAGATALGKFLVPTVPVEAGLTPEVVDEELSEDTEQPPLQYRWLLTMPQRYEWECKIVDQFDVPILDENGKQKTERRTSYLWTEVVERKSIHDDDDVRVMLWSPVSDTEVAEAERMWPWLSCWMLFLAKVFSLPASSRARAADSTDTTANNSGCGRASNHSSRPSCPQGIGIVGGLSWCRCRTSRGRVWKKSTIALSCLTASL